VNVDQRIRLLIGDLAVREVVAVVQLEEARARVKEMEEQLKNPKAPEPGEE
jgi:hypothetical protein